MAGLRQAVVEHFFWATVSGALSVTLASPEAEETIDLFTMDEVLERLDPDARQRLEPLVKLAFWADEQRTTKAVRELRSVEREWHDGPPDWPACLGEEDVSPLTAVLEADRRVAIRVPVTLTRKKPQQFDQPCYFDVFMEEADDALRPAFHRDLLLICEEPRRPQTVQGFRAVVVADDYGLARFLSLAEVPSHDHWEPNQQELPLEYTYASSLLSFVRNSVKHLGTRILDARPPEVDHTLTIDFFPRPDKETPPMPEPEGTGEEEGGTGTKVPPDVPEAARGLAIDGSGGRVRVHPGTSSAAGERIGRWLNVKLAYNIRRGNPLKNWQTDDFCLEDDEFEITGKGLSRVTRRDNTVSAHIDDADFSMTISGFDPLRDVYVRATMDDEGQRP
jgi:hypothetical protein